MLSSSHVQRLRYLCGGSDETGLIYGRFLSPIKSCELLLKVDGIEKSLDKDEESWIKLGTVLLPIINKSEKVRSFFTNIVKLILNNRQLKNRNEFLHKVWRYLERNIITENVQLMELFLLKEPKIFEIEIIRLFMDSTKIDTEMDVENYMQKHHSIILWCSYSRFIFSIASSIMNEILLRVVQQHSFSEEVSSFIHLFICKIANYCGTAQKDIADLYPFKYQGLVSMLDCLKIEGVCGKETRERLEIESAADETYEDMKRKVQLLVERKLKEEPHAAIALLTHQPVWLLELYCTSSNTMLSSH